MTDDTMIQSESSNIDALRYDEESGELHVRFKGGPTIYCYPGVTRETYEGLLTSESKGAYFDREVKKRVDKGLVRKLVPKE